MPSQVSANYTQKILIDNLKLSMPECVPYPQQGDIGMEGPRGGVGVMGETVSIDTMQLLCFVGNHMWFDIRDFISINLK